MVTTTNEIFKDPIIKTHVIDKPVVDEVIEHRTVEIHHKPVVIEIHEQPIIEIERIAQTKYVTDEAQTVVVNHDFRLEDPSVVLTETEIAMVQSLLQKQSKVMVKELHVPEGTKHIIKENIVEVPKHSPEVHTVYTNPVLRASDLTTTTRTTTTTSATEVIGATTTVVPSTISTTKSVTLIQAVIKNPKEHFKRIVTTGDVVWGLYYDGTLAKLRLNETTHTYSWVREGLLDFNATDISISSDGTLFFISAADRHLYRVMKFDQRTSFARVAPQENIRLTDITAANEHSVYALTEHGLLIHFDHDDIAKMSGKLKHISIGGPVKRIFKSDKYELWGIDEHNKAWMWNGINKWLCADPRVDIVDLCVGNDLHVHAVRADGVLLYWNREQHVWDIQKLSDPSLGNFVNVSTFKSGSSVFVTDLHGGVMQLSFK
ncbi:TecB [Acrasis kona]|uniref:TecB n=1 Tax=Acrasis kona TaxID=1008807 RepID=A0AAW2ZQ27_9EUKA